MHPQSIGQRQFQAGFVAYGSISEVNHAMFFVLGCWFHYSTKKDSSIIRYGGREVLLRVYIAVRDENWQTLPVLMHDLEIQKRRHPLSVRYQARTVGHVPFAWTAGITGEPSGRIVFTTHGHALADLRRIYAVA